MIENELRAAFARHENAMVDTARLRAAIDQEAARRRSRRTLLRASGAVLAVAAVPAVGLELVGARHRPGGPQRAGAPTGASKAAGALNLLLLGIDRRPGQSADSVAGADTIIVVHVPSTRDRAFLLSVPRDLRVTIPASDKTGYDKPTIDRLSKAFAVGSGNGGGVAGGVDLTAMTLNRLAGLKFDGAAVIDMAALRRVVDAVGGVYLCVEQEIRSMHTGRVFEPGCRHFNGEQAMDYLRQRLGLPNGALDRDRHNRQFLRSLVDRLLALDVLANPVAVSRILSAAGSGLTVDIPGRSLTDFIGDLPNISANAIKGINLSLRDLPIANDGSAPAFEFTPLLGELFEAIRRDSLTEFLVRHPELDSRG